MGHIIFSASSITSESLLHHFTRAAVDRGMSQDIETWKAGGDVSWRKDKDMEWGP
jgi:uncharacterized protein YijF (DUF1287 family)